MEKICPIREIAIKVSVTLLFQINPKAVEIGKEVRQRELIEECICLGKQCALWEETTGLTEEEKENKRVIQGHCGLIK